ncbi:MAG: ribosome silencing factor [Candidatus Hydrogenedentes bacterium]|nr:ribosome silencing factor [Candidatus Hydrogenedentota bacterium]
MATLIPKTKPVSEAERLDAIVQLMAELADEKKAKAIRAYNVTGLTLTTDALVICTATSEPHIKAIFNTVKDGMKVSGVRPIYAEGSFKDGWLLIDFGDAIFHVFREKSREFYDLDGLWADAPNFTLDL